jgi:hypothetical protein
MVDPLWRRGLRSGALFGWLMGTWMERFCGPTMSFLGWGFPSRGDFRIGQRYLAYECLHMVEVLVHTSIPDLAWSGASLVAGEGLGDERELAELWQRCRAGLPMTVERGPAYLRWRYRARPAARYVCTSVRDAHGALRGASVLRRGGLAEDTLLILEWLVPGDDEETERALLGLAASHARRLGCSSVALWLFPWQPAFERLRRLGFASHTTALCQTARSYDPATDLQWVREECAWSLGEIDFL